MTIWQKIGSRWPLLIILVVSAVPRLYNLGHSIGVHPDERHMIMVAEKLSLADMNPHSFAYGSFPYYLLWAFSRVMSLFSDWFMFYDGLFWVGRSICVAFGLVGIALTVRLARIVFKDETVALLSGVLLGLNVFHIQLSRFYTVDVILATLGTAALIVMLRIAQGKGWKHHLGCGVLMGLAVASKITALFLLAPLGIAFLVARYREHRFFAFRPMAQMLALIAVAGATFLAVEPYALLDMANFVRDSNEQTSMVRGMWRPPYTIQFEHTTPYLYHVKQFIYTMGWPVTLVVICGVVFAIVNACRRPRGEDLVVLAYFIPAFALIAGFQVKFPRYLIALYPPLLMLGASFLATIGRIGTASAMVESSPDFPVESSYRTQKKPFAENPFILALLPIANKIGAQVLRFVRSKLGIILGLVAIVIAVIATTNAIKTYRLNQYPGVFIGGTGSGPGYFKDLMAITVAPSGDIYAVDMYNSRIQRFDGNGRFKAEWGQRGEDQGEFNEPRGIAADRDGNIYVMDTWNGRIQKFDGDGNFILQMKSDPPFPGAKGVAVRDNYVYATDSGSGRVVVFDLEGEVIRSFGSKGRSPHQMLEPSGIAVDSTGSVFVVDSGNNRIQNFDGQGNLVNTFQITGWSGDTLKEAYLAVHDSGTLFLADSVGRGIKIFSPTMGETRSVIVDVISPCGVAVNQDTLFLGDRSGGRIGRFTLAGEAIR